MLVRFGTGEQQVETDMTQIPPTDIRPWQPWNRAQDQRQFEHADVRAQAPNALDRDITDSSNMAMSTQSGDALTPVRTVKDLPAILEDTHLLTYIFTHSIWARKQAVRKPPAAQTIPYYMSGRTYILPDRDGSHKGKVSKK